VAQFDIVFEGGGAKGTALAGGMQALIDQGHTHRRLVGTSAGAITATNLALGFTPQEIREGSLRKTEDGKSIYTTFSDAPPALSDEELLDTGLGQLLNKFPFPFGHARAAAIVMRALEHVPGMRGLLALAEEGGFHAGDAFVSWMHQMLRERSVSEDITLAELFEHTGTDLSLVATNTSSHSMMVFNHRTTPDLPVAWGVRMSMSIPLFWREVTWRSDWGSYLGEDITGDTIVDGGVVSNFPLHLITAPEDPTVKRWMGDAPAEKARALGFYLDAQQPIPGWSVPEHQPHFHSPLMARLNALLDTMMAASDNSAIHTHPHLVCRLPVKGVTATEFDLPDEGYTALFNGGLAATQAYLSAQGITGDNA
jgi:predicted acylesterase/phospholipase RssA